MQNTDKIPHRIDLIPVVSRKDPRDSLFCELLPDLFQDVRLLIPAKIPKGIVQKDERGLCREHPRKQGKHGLAL